MKVLIASLVIGALMVGLALLVGVVAGPVAALAGDKVHICHRDQGHPEWKEIEIAESALDAHLSHQWGADIYPVPVGGCPADATPTLEPTYTPTATDEPTYTPTATEEATNTPTQEPTVTPTGTQEPTVTPTDQPPPTHEGCPDGEVCYLGLG